MPLDYSFPFLLHSGAASSEICDVIRREYEKLCDDTTNH